MTFLAVKIVAAGLIVLGFSVLAERVGPRLAGILMGAPLGALISYVFIGIDAGPAYVAAGCPHAIAGMAGTLMFTYAYYRVSAALPTLAPLANAGLATSAGVALFLGWSLVIRGIHFTIPTALAVVVPVVVVGTVLFRRLQDLRILKPARLTFGLMGMRAGGAALLVSVVSSLAVVLGPAWGGLLMAFPMTLLPTMLIVHLTYSAAHVHAMLGAFPVGLGSVIVYIAAVSETFPRFGVGWGTAVALVAAWGYLGLLPLAFRLARRRRPAG